MAYALIAIAGLAVLSILALMALGWIVLELVGLLTDD